MTKIFDSIFKEEAFVELPRQASDFNKEGKVLRWDMCKSILFDKTMASSK